MYSGYYYTANGIRFQNKLHAVLEANKTKTPLTWYFYDEELSRVNWQHEPQMSLDALYKQRALQLRERYDYLILMVSGGADSRNMTYAFLDNGIMIDEVVAGAPLSGLKNWKIDLTNTESWQMASETFVAQLPLLDEIQKKIPTVKLTINDYFEDIVKLKPDKWLYEDSSHWIHFSGHTRHALDKMHHLKDLAENGKRVGIIYGIDKPILARTEDGFLDFHIFDSAVNIITRNFEDAYPNVDSVMFYYAHDLPELMVKQGHVVARSMYANPRDLARRLLWDESKPPAFNTYGLRGSKWQRAIVPYIYPSIQGDRLVWQADKCEPGFIGGRQIDGWMYHLHGETPMMKIVTNELTHLVKQLDRQYFMRPDDPDLGFQRFSRSWRLGHESQYMPTLQSFVLP